MEQFGASDADGRAFMGWYALLQLKAHTFEPISREFELRTGLPVTWYEVLANLQHDLDDASGGRRMNELADDLLVSRGGATKLISRIEAAGLVERITPAHDRRATFAKLTPAGEAALVAAHPVQLELVREYFGQYVSDEELVQLITIASKVLRGVGAPCNWLDDAQVEAASSASLPTASASPASD